MNFSNACREVKGKLPLTGYLPKLDDSLRNGIEKTYVIIKENKEITIPMALGVGSYLITCHTGYPFPEFDKLMHLSFGYGTSALGRKIARRFNKEKYENLISLATALAGSAAIELWETSPVTMSTSNALSGAAYKKTFGLQTIDPLDIEANAAGSLAENVKEYASRARNKILRKSEVSLERDLNP